VFKKNSGLCIYQMRGPFLLVLGRNARQFVDPGSQIFDRDQDALAKLARREAAGGYFRANFGRSDVGYFRGLGDAE
jgi:hypothetical protein